eukprot:15332180-Ditylum_brightwellii.AAC.1
MPYSTLPPFHAGSFGACAWLEGFDQPGSWVEADLQGFQDRLQAATGLGVMARLTDIESLLDSIQQAEQSLIFLAMTTLDKGRVSVLRCFDVFSSMEE